MNEPIQVFDSTGDAYQRSFHVFLQHTDQKTKARRWFEIFLTSLPQTKVMIDAGAGSGELTAWLAPWFEQTIAVEPNPFLLEKLQRVLPTAEAICKPILEATPSRKADLLVCSHTFYYIAASSWGDHLDRLLSWTKPTGSLVIVLQHHETDCMRMLEHFCGHHFNLSVLADRMRKTHGSRYTMDLRRDEAYIETPDFDTAFVIAVFMLNLLPLHAPPSRSAVESYIRSHFTPVRNGYRFSCHQGFLQIRGNEGHVENR